VRLFTPQLNASDFGVSGGTVTGATAMTAANPFGTGATVDASAVGVSVNTASRFTFTSPGSYLVEISMAGTVLAALFVSGTSNCTVTATMATFINGASTFMARSFLLNCTAPNAYFDVTATATTVTSALLCFGSVPDGSLAFFTARNERARLECFERAKMREHCKDLSRPDLILLYRCPSDCSCRVASDPLTC